MPRFADRFFGRGFGVGGFLVRGFGKNGVRRIVKVFWVSGYMGKNGYEVYGYDGFRVYGYDGFRVYGYDGYEGLWL